MSRLPNACHAIIPEAKVVTIELIEAADDVELPPFTQKGGLGKVYRLIGKELTSVMHNLNIALVT